MTTEQRDQVPKATELAEFGSCDKRTLDDGSYRFESWCTHCDRWRSQQHNLDCPVVLEFNRAMLVAYLDSQGKSDNYVSDCVDKLRLYLGDEWHVNR